MKNKKSSIEQAAYQRSYRHEQKSLRKPSRDDVARIALHWIITEALQRDKEAELGKWERIMTERLVAQGFDRTATCIRINELIDRYDHGWEFQLKPQFQREDGSQE